ncbi:MAG: hypothetical protein HGB12_08395 [Bacteroidetes bacterium]|nr:hypothetical protein [Bacteroidota bacterium]
MYNGKFNQCLSVVINCEDHKTCLDITNTIKKQCDAWYFCVKYDESKSARKGPVLKRNLMIYQTAYAPDIVIFKEALRRVCNYFSLCHNAVTFTELGVEPENDLRKQKYPIT